MDTNGFGAASVAQTSKSVSICPNRRRPRESLVLVVVLVLVIGDGAVEDEKEDEDDLIAAPPRCAVSRVSKPADRTNRRGPMICSSHCESQRDSGSKPRVARNELPWETGSKHVATPTGL